MKTSDIAFLPINNTTNNLDVFFYLISQEKHIDRFKKDDWLGEFIFQIYDIKRDIEVGYISYSRWDNNYCISCLYIHEQFRKKGFGTAAIRKLLTKLKIYKPDYIFGFVHKNNSTAIRIYKAAGFRFLNSSKMGYTVIEPNEKDCNITDNFYEFGMRGL